MAAIERLRRIASAWTSGLFGGVFGGLLAGGGSAHAAPLPDDQAELMFHSYDGGGVRASGPALLVRKSLADRVSLSAQYYVDAVSNASIDVVTTASPFRETRHEWQLGATGVVRDATLTLTGSHSAEPDYLADAINADIAHEVFGGMTTVSLGFYRGHDEVGKKGTPGWIDTATHWKYRVGVTQILSPRWLVSLNAEAVADSGYLGSPYRVARIFGAAVPERDPRTRSSRALTLRTTLDTGDWLPRSSLRAEYRTYWDNWAIRAGTAEIGAAKYLGANFLVDARLRVYSQRKALFYSDNAGAETQYLSRNRQLGTFDSTTVGAGVAYSWPRAPAGWDVKLNAAYQRIAYRYKDFTDLRTGRPYADDANVLQLYITAAY
ncbi:MAG: DUF3570 domain-containing protein [Burkholderiales bacterium]|nr:DUF3570 domain-containing protein [Burkholderiales bacterium]